MKVQKKQSKRQPLRHKYKVERKVREHKRKQRKEAILNPQSQKKKDPGIPNLWPFKEQMLERFQAQKEKAEEDKKIKKELNKQKKALSIQQMASDAQRRQEEFQDKETAFQMNKDLDFDKLPEHSKRAYYREFKKVVEASDVLLEVLDARDPLGCRTRSIEHMISAYGNKKIILVLNKIDLVPKEIVLDWLKYLRNEFPAVAFKCSTGTQRQNIGQSKATVESTSLISSNECLGASTLLQLLKNYSRSADIKTSITVGIIGYPNVGKSSLINSLNRSKVVGVGSTPGFTKVMQEVQLDKKVKLLDCPGIVFATGTEENAGDIILRNCVRVEKIADPIKPIEAILRRCNPAQLMVKYKIAAFSSPHEFLSHIARRRGKLLKGGIPDYQDAARIVLQDWNSGNISYFTVPPAPKPKSTHEVACVVSEFSKEFDIDKLLEEGDQQVVSVLPSIHSVERDALVEMTTGDSLDELFVRMVISDSNAQAQAAESKNEESEGSDIEEDEEEMADDNSDAESDDAMNDTRSSAPHVKNPIRASDEYNPQLNQQRKKQQKKQKKLQKKLKVANQEPFDFKTDFIADTDLVQGDENDDDLLNI